MNKSALRAVFLEKRKQLDPTGLEERSVLIAGEFAKLKLEKVEYLHLYYPIAGRGEIDTLRIVEYVRVNHPEIKLVLSKASLKENTLSHILWEASTPLAMNSWGITEPECGEFVSPHLLDMILIPLLGFDLKGNRIGYGKGFYDRFLAECRPDAVKIGLSCFEPVESISDVDEYDVPLDMCITPGKIWHFKPLQ